MPAKRKKSPSTWHRRDQCEIRVAAACIMIRFAAVGKPRKLTILFTGLFTALAFLPSAFAQNPDDYRGGWKTEVNGVPRTWEFSIRGESVRGIYYTWCADATTLAFVDGKFGPDGLSFTVTHVDNNGKTTFTDTGTAKFEKPNLVVTRHLRRPGIHGCTAVAPGSQPLVARIFVGEMVRRHPGGLTPSECATIPGSIGTE